MHAFGEQGIVDLAHPHPGALLHPFNRRLCRQATINRFVYPPPPTFIIGEHFIHFEDFTVFAFDAKFGLRRHPLNLFTHFIERSIDAVALCLSVFGHGMFNGDTGLVKDRVAARHTVNKLQSAERVCAAGLNFRPALFGIVDQVRVGDQFRQDHSHCLKRLNLHLFIATRFDMLDAEHAHGILLADDRHPGKTVKQIFTRFRSIGKIRVAGRFVQVQRRNLFSDRADQAFAQSKLCNVHGFLFQPPRGKEFQHAFAAEIDGANLAAQDFADHIGDLVKLGLRAGAGGHDIMKAAEDFAGGCCGGGGHEDWLTDYRCTFHRGCCQRCHDTISERKWNTGLRARSSISIWMLFLLPANSGIFPNYAASLSLWAAHQNEESWQPPVTKPVNLG